MSWLIRAYVCEVPHVNEGINHESTKRRKHEKGIMGKADFESTMLGKFEREDLISILPNSDITLRLQA